MLQSSDKSDTVKNHPVIQRIVDLRKMFKTCAQTGYIYLFIHIYTGYFYIVND